MSNPYDIAPTQTSAPAGTQANIYDAASGTKPAVPLPPAPFDATPLGLAFNTITGLLTPSNIFKAVSSIGQGVARDFASVGNSFLDAIFPRANLQTVEEPSYLQPIFGTEPINDMATNVLNFSDAIKNSPIAQKFGLDKAAFPLAFAGVVGNSALDLTPFGGEGDGLANLAKTIAKESDPEVIASTLRQVGITGDIADKFAPDLAKTQDTAEVHTALKMMQGSQTMHDVSLATGNEPPDLTNHFLEIPPDIEEKAQSDWTENYAENYGKIYDAQAKLSEVLKTTPAKGQQVVKAQIDKLTAASAQMEHEWMAKWQQEATAAAFHADGEVLDQKRPLDQLAADLLDGKTKIGVGQVAKTEAREALGPSLYMRVFSKKSGTTLDEHLNNLREIGHDHSEADLFDAINQEAQIRKAAAEQANGARAARIAANKEAKGIIEPPPGSASVLSDAKNSILYASPSDYAAKVTPGDFTKILQLNESLEAKGLANFGDKTVEQVPLGSKAWQNRITKAFYNYAKKQKDGELNIRPVATAVKKSPERIAQEEAASSAGVRKIPVQKNAEEIIPGHKIVTPADILTDKPINEIQAMKPVVDAKFPSAVDKVHLLDYLATPEFVLEKVGLGKEAEMLHDADFNYHQTLKKEITQIEAWRKEVGASPHTSEAIFKYLDGETNVKKDLTDTEYKVALEMKDYLKNWATRLKLPEDSQITHYITHLFDPEAVQKDFDPELANIIADKTAGSVYDPFLQKRTGSQEYKQDVWAALDAYVKRGSRKEAFDPALEAMKGASMRLDQATQKYVMRLSHRINLRPTELDNLADNLIKSFAGYRFGQRPISYLTNKIRSVFYRGTLGLNLGSALRNLTQGVNTYAKLGEVYTTVGYTKLFSRLITNNLGELFEHGILDDALMQDRKVGVYKSMMQKLDPVLFKFFDMTEKINRGSAYFGAKAKYMAAGQSEPEAIKNAKRLVRETQFAFGNVDTPVAMSSDLAKTVMQLQTYNIKEIEFLSRMVANKEFAGLVRFGLGSFVALNTIGKIFGMTPSQLIPTIGIGGSPLGQGLSALVEDVMGNAQQKAAAQKQIQGILVDLLPAGAQIRKTVQGIQAFKAGKDVTATGKTRYNIPQNGLTEAQAALFGKSALPQAQTYYQNIGKKKPSSGNNPYD